MKFSSYFPPLPAFPLSVEPFRPVLERAARHVVLVCTNSYDAELGYVVPAAQSLATLRPCAADSLVEGHFAMLEEILLLAAPSTRESLALPYVGRRPDLLCDFHRVMKVFATDPTIEPRTVTRVQRALNQALAQWHFAFAHHLFEVAASLDSRSELNRLAKLVEKARANARPAAAAALGDAGDYLYAVGATRPVPRPAAPVQDTPSLIQPPLLPAVQQFLPLQATSPAATSGRILTGSQRKILNYCRLLGDIHFRRSPAPSPGLFTPRLNPLIAAPTGAGKSALVQELARGLRIHYMRVQRGDFYPQGTSRGVPTVFAVLNQLATNPGGILLHFDELDKWVFSEQTPSHEWSAGIYSDLFSMLDGAWPLQAYLEFPGRVIIPGCDVTIESLRQDARRVFIVGSGTWQQLFDTTRLQRPAMGFTGATSPVKRSVDGADVFASRQIAPELLARFHTDLQMMSYPSREELAQLLDQTGLQAMARACGYTITEGDLDFSRGGFRVLETLYTRLLIIQAQRDFVPSSPGADLEPMLKN